MSIRRTASFGLPMTPAGGARRVATAAKLVAAVAAAVLLVTGCQQDNPNDSAGSDGGDSKEPITIGISLPLTGDFSQPGGEAKRGYEVWRDMVNEDGGILGRAGQAEDRRRRQQPGHRRLGLHEADHAGQGRPGARHVLLAAQLPGVRGGREAGLRLRRAGRWRAGHVQPRLRVPLLRPAGDRAAPGRRLRRLHQVAARGRPARRPRPTRPRTTRSPARSSSRCSSSSRRSA